MRAARGAGGAPAPPAAPVFASAARDRGRGRADGDDSDERPLSENETQAKIAQFRSFIDAKLKVDLKRVLDERDRLYQKIADHVQLKKNLEVLQASKQTRLTTRVNLGCDFYTEAVVPDTSLIVLDIGLGFQVELTLEEAVRFIADKEEHMERLAKTLSRRAAVISSHIKMVYEGIAELMRLQPKPAPQRGASFYG